MAEVKLDTFKVTYSFWKDVLAIACGILLAQVVTFAVQVGLMFLIH